MKTRLLVMVGMMISTTIFAQNETGNSRKPEESGYERMKRELALTDKQYASVKEVDGKYHKQFREYERKRLEEREAVQTLRLDRERDLRKVLTPEQNKKRDEYRVTRKGNKFMHAKGKRKHAREFRHRGKHKGDRKGRGQNGRG